MLTTIHPKLPMRNKATTLAYYTQLGFSNIGQHDYPGYLILQKDAIELHFFEHPTLIPAENDGQVYIRCSGIESLYQQWLSESVAIHPNGALTMKPWGQKEFSLLDPDNNLLTFGEAV